MGAMGQHKVHTTERLKHLRDLMRKEDVNVQAFVVPSEDQRTLHISFSWFKLRFIQGFFVLFLDSSEYLASCDQRRAYISGFNGSAGKNVQALELPSMCSTASELFQDARSLHWIKLSYSPMAVISFKRRTSWMS